MAHPTSLFGRIVFILLLTVAVEFGASTLLYERATHFSIQGDEAHRLAEHLVIASKLIEERPATTRPQMAHELSTDRYDVRWIADARDLPPVSASLDTMRRQILEWEPGLVRSHLRLRFSPLAHGSIISGDMRLEDGSGLLFRMRDATYGWGLTLERVAIALLPTIVLLLLGALMIRQTMRPLRGLIGATTRVGRADHAPVAEDGSSEIRGLIRAFNAMQLRIHHLIENRTQALAAVGHDLRTPLARLQLRFDSVKDDETREAMSGDVAEMEAMIASLLAFLGGEDDPERPAVNDVAVLVATLVDGAADRGADAVYKGPAHLELSVRASSLRRAIGNLIENALHYGGNARVTLKREGTGAAIIVDDDGSGIPEDRLEDVTRPFIRLDNARQRNTQGLGLGLAIVAKAVAQEGGTLTLANRRGGGFRATIRLQQH